MEPSESDADTLSPGDRIGPYEVTGLVGSGGMGEVFAARDARLERSIAIKVLPASFARDPERQRRFEREARAIAAIDHPNVLVVHDVGEHEGRAYIVSELLDGSSLRERLREGRLPPRKAVEIGIQVARGLAAAHDKGIVHRDLKPENVFLTREGRAKVLDFGLARMEVPALDREGETEAPREEGTSPGVLLGTVAYMAPEQARGRTADARSDVFALGTVLYEMLSGRRPFAGATQADTLSAILREEPAPFEAGSSVVPPSLERVVRRCLEKEPAERFQTARDVGFALEALGHSGESVPSGTALGPASDRGPVSRLRGRAILQTAGLLVAGAAVVLGARGLLVPRRPPRIVGYRPLANGAFGRVNSFTTDGERVYVTIRDGLETRQVALVGGGSAPIPQPFTRGFVLDASKARSSLLMRTPGFPNSALWSVPVPAGSARVLGLDANNASWSRDGQKLAVTQLAPNRLLAADGDGSHPRLLFETDDIALAPHWSPDGRRIRFTLQDVQTTQFWVAQIDARGGKVRRLFAGLGGSWTARDDVYLFANGDASTGWGFAAGGGTAGRINTFGATEPPWWQPWRRPRVEQLTYGPLDLGFPQSGDDGRGTVALAWERRGAVMRLDAATGRFEPTLGGRYAAFLDYSRDGQWVAWVDARELTLWRSRPDGTETLQLTEAPLAVGLVRWSPDGKRLVFVGKPPDTLPRIYVLPSEGGTPEPVSEPEPGEVWDPCWLPGGNQLVWGRIHAGGIRLFDVTKNSKTVLAKTEDLFFPKCSPDGRLLLTRSVASAGLPAQSTSTSLLYDPATGAREELPQTLSGLSYPTFTRDGHTVVGCTADGISAFSLPDRRMRKVADFGTIVPTAPLYNTCWTGLDSTDAPVVLNDTSSQEIYALDIEQP